MDAERHRTPTFPCLTSPALTFPDLLSLMNVWLVIQVATASAVSIKPPVFSQQQPARNDPTPHPAFLKQPLPSSRTDQGTSQRPDQGTSQRPERAPAAAELHLEKPKEACGKVHMHSGVPGAHPESSSNPSQSGRNPSPQPAPSPKPSVSHSTHSDEDTEMEEASHGSHGVASAQGPLLRATSTKEAAQEGDGEGQTGAKVPSSVSLTLPVSTAKSPTVGPRDSASPTSKDGGAFGREGDKKRKSSDSRDSKDASR